MQRMIRLTAWNWHMARRWQLAIAALMGLVQAGLLLFAALNPQNALVGYEGMFDGSLCPLVFAVAYCAAAVAAQRPVIQGRGRSRPVYTMLTLQMPRWQLALAQILATLLPLVLLIAWQLIVNAALYGPVRLLQGSMGVLSASVPLGMVSNFWWETTVSPLIRLLLPATPLGGAALLVFLAAPAVLVPPVFVYTGWRRWVALAAALAGFVGCLALAVTTLQSL